MSTNNPYRGGWKDDESRKNISEQSSQNYPPYPSHNQFNTNGTEDAAYDSAARSSHLNNQHRYRTQSENNAPSQYASGAGSHQRQNQWEATPGTGTDPTQTLGAHPTDTEATEGRGTQQPIKERRTVGLGSAMALMLVGAIAAGSITGVIATKASSDNNSNVVNSLEIPSVSSGGGGDDSSEQAAQGTTEHVARTVLPAVVSINVYSRAGSVEGSGSIISEDGYVLTNNHVISFAAQGGAQIEVALNDGTKKEADLVATDPETDIAVIKMRGASDLPVIQFGDSDTLQVGQGVVAIGSPLGLNATVTTGIVSALHRPVRAEEATGEFSVIDAVQTDAAINMGNSGGPLVDMNGNLIGMNTMIASTGSSQEAGSIGLGFAIPANFAKRVSQQLIENGEAKHPMLGVSLPRRETSPVDGAMVADVEGGGPADNAGIKKGDVITRVDDRLIESGDGLVATIRSKDFGDTVTLHVLRGGEGEPETVEVTLTGK